MTAVSSLAVAVYGAGAMSPIRAYHLPEGCRPRTRSLVAHGVELEVASPDASEWAPIEEACRRARRRLRRRGIDDVLVALQKAYDGWMAGDSCHRQLADQILPSVTGFSPEMIRHALPKVLEPLQADAIRDLLAAELCSSQGRAPITPGLLIHILSGNIPGLAAIPMHLSLAIQSAAIFKTAAGDPLSAALWAQAIAEADPELGNCLAVTHWAGGDDAVENVVFAAADLVVASGSDPAISAIASRVHGRFVGYGHKISFAVIGKECLTPDGAARLARGLAYDTSVWDQQGCLSPHLCYVEAGGRVDPDDFAAMLAQWLEHYAATLPPRRLTLDEKTAILHFREETEWTAGASLLASRDSSAWSIAVECDARFRATCLNRCIRVKVISALDEMVPALRDHRRHLEAAGLAVGRPRHREIAQTLGEGGVHRLCAIGRMQQPPLSWCSGGRPRIGDWVDWMQLEACDER